MWFSQNILALLVEPVVVGFDVVTVVDIGSVVVGITSIDTVGPVPY